MPKAASGIARDYASWPLWSAEWPRTHHHAAAPPNARRLLDPSSGTNILHGLRRQILSKAADLLVQLLEEGEPLRSHPSPEGAAMTYIVQIPSPTTSGGWQTISKPFDTREEAEKWRQRLSAVGESKIVERR